MPFKDAEARREYFRAYMARRRAAGAVPWEQTDEAREAKTVAKRRERERKRQDAVKTITKGR